MENLRTVTLGLLLLAGATIIAPLFSFAYEPETTHRALTQEIVKMFNRSFPALAINDGDMEDVMRGSVDEDNGARALHHFYDPIRKSGIAISGMEFEHAKSWAKNTSSQAGMLDSTFAGTLKSFFSGEKDYSWDRAIYEYSWGDRKRGLASLGHILHLMEDMAVPDHTRNDKHPPYADKLFHQSSPYEHWADKFNKDNISVFEKMPSVEAPRQCADLGTCFELMALYSNTNFFSKDTILKGYELPKIVKEKIEVINGVPRRFGFHSENYRLVKIDKKFGEKETQYSLDAPKDLILSDYWSLLSRQAVLHGAGVIKRFFDEVEKEKQTKALYAKNRSSLGKMVDAAKERVFNLGSAIYGITVPYDLSKLDEADAAGASVSPKTESSGQAANAAALTSSKQANSPQPNPPQASNAAITIERSIVIDTKNFPAETSEANPANSSQAAGRSEKSKSPESKPAPLPPPSRGGASVQNTREPDPAQQSENTAQSAVPQPADDSAQSQTASSANAAQATSTPDFSAAPEANFPDASIASSSPPADTTPPDISLSIAECSASLSQEGCLIATTTLSVSWSSQAEDLDHYNAECFKNSSSAPAEAGPLDKFGASAPCPGFPYAGTATSTAISADDGAAYTIRVSAFDKSGNTSAPLSQTIEINTAPVVINEIAWAGTSADTPADEWIELYNRSSKPVALSNWTLRSQTDGKPHLELSGSIPAKGYYLIERTDDNTVSDVPADLTASFGSGSGMGLADSGEVLLLEYASITIDQTPRIETCHAFRWCGGNVYDRSTMERIDPDLPGDSPESWDSNDKLIKNGHAANGAIINGTPKVRNSRSHYIARGQMLDKSKTITKKNGPYIIGQDGLIIREGVTLVIEPGTVIKFAPDTAFPSLDVRGQVIAKGTAGNSIVFTSFYDDSYGGDLNNDGMCDPLNASSTAACPQAGNWHTIYINSASARSSFEHTLFRYGGKFGRYWGPPAIGMHAMVSVVSSSADFKNSVFERAGSGGVRFSESYGSVSDSVIRYTWGSLSEGYALLADRGAVSIENNLVEHNFYRGIGAFDGPHRVIGNSFAGNRDAAAALWLSNAATGTPVFANNRAEGNGINGIMALALGADYTFEKDLPYVFAYGHFTATGTTAIKPGAVFKISNGIFATFTGALRAKGTTEEPIVFTSLKDDSYGGDTNNDGMCGFDSLDKLGTSKLTASDPLNAASTSSGPVACPRAGDWMTILLNKTSSPSILKNVVIRYGGRCGDCGALKIFGAEAEISDTVFEKNDSFGLWLADSASAKIFSTTFRDHKQIHWYNYSDPVGLRLSGSSRAELDAVSFVNNKIGIAADDSSSATTGEGGVIFDGNDTDTIPAGLVP